MKFEGVRGSTRQSDGCLGGEIGLRCAIQDGPETCLSRELCNRINKVKNDLRMFGKSLRVKFQPGPLILSEDCRSKRELLARAFGCQDVTRFMDPCRYLNAITKFLSDPKQFKEMKTKLEKPGAVIQLAAPFPAPSNAGKCTVLYNHPNYLKLRAVRKRRQASADEDEDLHYIHITGDPGVGKSHYLIFDLLSTMIENVKVKDFKVVLILSKMAFAYSRSSGWFDCRSKEDAVSALGKEVNRWDTYLFADCCDLEDPTCHTISVSSPNRKHFEQFEKSGAERRFLPSWTLNELTDAFVEMSKLNVFKYPEGHRRHVSEESIRIEFEVWGGIPRILYQKLDRFVEHRLYKFVVDPITFECDG